MSTDARKLGSNAKLLAQIPISRRREMQERAHAEFCRPTGYFAFAFAASLTSRLKKAAVIPKARE